MQRLVKLPTRQADAMTLSGIVLVVCLVLGLLPARSGAQRRVQLYEPQHRTAEELVPLAQTVLSGSGSVAIDRGTDSLVLIGDPGDVSAALDLLASQDRALRSIVLRYDTRRLRELVVQGFQVRWTRATGAFRLGNVRIAPDPDSSIRVRTTGALLRLVDSFGGRMRVLEGEATRIETGTVLPYTLAGPSGTSTAFVNATTGFEARPRILADGRVEVDLAAFARELRLDRVFDSMGASTRVIVEPGSVVVVASSSRADAENRTNALGGTRADQRRDETVLLLRADVESTPSASRTRNASVPSADHPVVDPRF